MQTDISVIVPCYCAESYLESCLESLRAQQQPQIEMILIDDGSTDATGVILDRFAESEPRARVVHTKNGGVSAARNLGLDLASGRYIAFADADDCLEERALERLYEYAQQTKAQIVSAEHVLWDMQTGERKALHVEPVPQNPETIVREILHMHRIYNNIWNKLYDRTLFDGLRLDTGVKIGEDALLNVQLYLRASSVAHLDAQTYVYRIHGGSAMAKVSAYSEAHQPMLRGMSEALSRAGKKEFYFRDFLQSAVWIDEKTRGIGACMRTFSTRIQPLVLDGVDPKRLSAQETGLYRWVRMGGFPLFYIGTRIMEKVTGKMWGIRR